MTLQIKLTHKDAILPTRGHPTDAGLDLTAVSLIKPLRSDVLVFDTGVAVQPPEGFYTQVVMRSSSSKQGITLANGTGIIDPSYTGSIKLAIRFHMGAVSADDLIGTRVAQLLVKPLHLLEVVEVDELDNTKRGDGGFGSTGQ